MEIIDPLNLVGGEPSKDDSGLFDKVSTWGFVFNPTKEPKLAVTPPFFQDYVDQNTLKVYQYCFGRVRVPRKLKKQLLKSGGTERHLIKFFERKLSRPIKFFKTEVKFG